MTKEKQQEYITALELGNRGFQAIMHHPLVGEIKKSENLRYWVPDEVVPEKETEDFSEFEHLWTTNRIAKNIAAFLRLNGFTIDFKNSTVSKDGGKNNQRVGRILNVLHPKLLESWKKLTNKNFSSTKNNGKRGWVISANPIDIAGSSYRRKWTSCTCDGHHMYRIGQDRFSFIAYLCDKTDTNIKDPHCRYFIHVGVPTTKNKTKIINFQLIGDNVPPGKTTISLKVPDTIIDSDKVVGSLFLDTKYGNCTSLEFDQLSNFVTKCNDNALNINGVQSMNIKVEGLYVNTYTLPSKISLSSSIAKTKVASKKAKAVKKIDDLALRVQNYRKYSNRPSYELVEYVINTSHFDNQYLNDAIFGDKELSQYVKVDVIDNKITQSKEKLESDKQKIAQCSDHREIIQIAEDIEICVNSYNHLMKIKSDITKSIDKVSGGKSLKA